MWIRIQEVKKQKSEPLLEVKNGLEKQKIWLSFFHFSIFAICERFAGNLFENVVVYLSTLWIRIQLELNTDQDPYQHYNECGSETLTNTQNEYELVTLRYQ